MRKYILARKGWSWLSGKTLARFYRANEIPFYVTEKTYKKNIAVNWGNSSCVNALLNQKINTNKRFQLSLLNNAEIPTLKLYRRNPPRDGILVARQINHQAGKDIVLVKPEDRLPYAGYYTVFEHFKRELRIHAFIVDEEIFTRGFKKVTDNEEELYPIRNLDHGYNFKLVPLSDKLKELSKKILNTLEMDFGCLDVGIKDDDERYTVIEVNSAPSLVNNEISLRWYANNIGRRLFPDWEIIE